MKLKRIMTIFAVILMLLLSVTAFAEDNAAQQSQDVMFSDIPADAPYAQAVKKLVEYGIINGYDDGTFRPMGEVTRAEMCKMINLALGYTDFSSTKGFPDVTMTNWYYTFALAAQKAGYVEGYEDGTFRGSNNITRQEVCAILNRLLKPMNLGTPVTITDKVSGWAKQHVELIVQNYIMPLEANNTFRATENLKRHELATVLSNLAIGPVKNIEAEVRFFINGVQYDETQLVVVGNRIKLPENPTPPDETYVFDGWRVVGTKEPVDAASLIVIGDVDYEAVFIKKTYRVEFHSFKSLYDTQYVEHNMYADAPQNPAVKGYEFLGWSLSDGGDTVRISGVKITSPVTFYAVFEKSIEDEDENKDDEKEETPEQKPDENPEDKEENPEDKEENPEQKPEEKPEEPKEVTYKVRFFVDGFMEEEQTVKEKEAPENPSVKPVKDGYKFVGWAFDGTEDVINISSISVTKNIRLVAVFEKLPEPPKEYTVTFMADGAVHKTQTVVEGESPKSVSTPKKDGYTFEYWANESGREVKLDMYTVKSDVTFYAVFEEIVPEVKYFSVAFYVDGSVYHTLEQVKENTTVSAPKAPDKKGHDFKGWSLSNGGTVITLSSQKITKDTAFYAVFEKQPEPEPEEYKVVFMVDGGILKTEDVIENNFATAPKSPTKDGYDFVGWSLSNGGSVVTVSATKITADTTFYAVFEKKEEEKPVEYEVKFMVDGKMTGTVQKVKKGEYPTVPSDPAKDKHKFLGWSKTEGSANIVNPAAVAINENTVYYAIFEKIEEKPVYHKVIFWNNGSVYYSTEVLNDECAGEPDAPSVSDGNVFAGWSLKQGSDVEVDVESYKITKPTDFYAIILENPNDPELIEKLERGLSQLKKIRVTNSKHRRTINTITSCMSMVLADAQSGEHVDKNYVGTVYHEEFKAVENLIMNEMTSAEQSAFINILTNENNIDKDIQDFLIDYFDIDMNMI